ncbi:ImmA/IrrE family metallo-endopeptidase [Leucobacter allii]|uniref:ImmA/IrrE family metallo-endopeptidase n=1 Tax=Leucobacter allii TaxID=2932247 RepID=A0ABY4FPD0_9MICO|nr:ImmA/IrrE family metallo-endopeptidase [Leucobacter allii]UOQ58135.1 ImmA/IrrE family metallo-endopeptidase [Leucobacter allii]
MQQLFDLADAGNISVEFRPLAQRNGEYRDDLKRIRLREDMPPRLMRFTFAHELGHAAFRDVPSMFGPENARQERRADEWAALRLIELDAYREFEALREGHVPAIAHDLGVVTRCVEAYQRLLERIGDTVYLDPHMGAGQWLAKVEAA